MASYTNAKQSIPEVFKLIIENHAERARLVEGVVLDIGYCRMIRPKLKELRDYMDKSLRPSAERALRWNTDKGNAAR